MRNPRMFWINLAILILVCVVVYAIFYPMFSARLEHAQNEPRHLSSVGAFSLVAVAA